MSVPAQIRQLIFIMMEDELTDLCGNRVLQNDLVNTSCQIKTLQYKEHLSVFNAEPKLGENPATIYCSSKGRLRAPSLTGLVSVQQQDLPRLVTSCGTLRPGP